MKKGLLTSIICFTSLVFSSCGTTRVKVTLVGDEYIGFEKETDIADVNKDYSIKAVAKQRGYALYPENLTIKIKNNLVFEGEGLAYTFDISTQTIKIKEKAIVGDILIAGIGRERENTVTCTFDEESYVGLQKVYVDCEYGTDFIISEINLITELLEAGKTMPSKDEIKVYPEDIEFEYKQKESGDKKPYYIKIPGNKFYTDVTFTFPSIEEL